MLADPDQTTMSDVLDLAARDLGNELCQGMDRK
jgi:hypothetical protein